MKTLIRIKHFISLAVFLISLAASAVYISKSIADKKQEAMVHAGYVIAGEIGKLQYAVDSRLMDTEILEMIIVDGNGTINNFDKIAASLYKNDPAVGSIQLAPNGNVSYVYPLEGNEDAFGDLFSDPDRKTEAEYARDTGKMTLAGPFELYQGGMGLVARNPIYLEGGGHEHEFWGFSIVVLNVPEIFQAAGLDDLIGQGYSYRIWRIHPDTGDVQIIDESPNYSVQEAHIPVDAELTVPNGVWTLSIVPDGGWVSSDYIKLKCTLYFVVSLLLSVFVLGFFMSEQQKQDLSILANTDPLTKLHNERFLASSLNSLILHSEPFCLFYLDLNKFKQVNDQYGHDIGDALLAETAQRMKQCISSEDLAFRVGGDEFALILSGFHKTDDLEYFRENLRKTIEQPFVIEGITLYPKISCGFSRFPDDHNSREDLLRHADQCMYEEKRHSCIL